MSIQSYEKMATLIPDCISADLSQKPLTRPTLYSLPQTCIFQKPTPHSPQPPFSKGGRKRREHAFGKNLPLPAHRGGRKLDSSPPLAGLGAGDLENNLDRLLKFEINELVAQLSKLAIWESDVSNQDRILGYTEI
jgi:hypothetical protein